MSRRRRVRRAVGTRRYRPRYNRRARHYQPNLIDHVLIAGIVGGGLDVVLTLVLTVPWKPAAVISGVMGLIAFGFTLGITAPRLRLRSPFRSPIVMRRRY